MSAAALRYFEVTGARLFVTPIPNTTPQLFFAAGERESIIELLTSGAPVGRRIDCVKALTDASTTGMSRS